jgi:hypothetical protein
VLFGFSLPQSVAVVTFSTQVARNKKGKSSELRQAGVCSVGPKGTGWGWFHFHMTRQNSAKKPVAPSGAYRPARFNNRLIAGKPYDIDAARLISSPGHDQPLRTARTAGRGLSRFLTSKNTR